MKKEEKQQCILVEDILIFIFSYFAIPLSQLGLGQKAANCD